MSPYQEGLLAAEPSKNSVAQQYPRGRAVGGLPLLLCLLPEYGDSKHAYTERPARRINEDN